jgi:protein O-GlcNAc transferase
MNCCSSNLRAMIKIKLKNKKATKINLHTGNFTLRQSSQIYNRGLVFQKSGQFMEAINCYIKSIELNQNNADPYINLGSILQERGQINEAIKYYEKALELRPNDASANYNLGTALQKLGQLEKAIICYEKALQINPTNTLAYNNLGSALQQKGKLDEAITCYKRAINLNPNYTNALSNLGSSLYEKGQFEEAITCYKKALHINSAHTEAHFNLGNIFREQGRQEEAISCFNKAIDCNPAFNKAKLMHCMSQLPIIYSDAEDINKFRNRYYNELIKLEETISLKTPEDIGTAADAIGSMQPFYLAYQGLNDRELQQIYGNLICKIMAVRYPEFAKKPAMPSLSSGELIRVGIVSGFFYLHSNWKIPIKGWIENLDKRKFRLFGYYTGQTKDQETEIARNCFSRFLENIYSIQELIETIRRDNLHVLIYPEVGMNPMSLRLATLRLAPIQCTSWGHPDTSGLPTIDYFLSSDLMESPDADDYYTEKLVRLPNLSVYYTPLDFPPVDINRETFNLRKRSVLYLCCQSLFKYLPQYDKIYPRIAKEVGNCQFLFISNKSGYVTEQFRRRIYQSFEKFGLRAEDYVVFLPRLDARQYNAINSLSDIYLDSIGWSGCNSTFEAIACDLPIVTIPGKFMRGRHSFAILKMMGVTETIGITLNDHIEIAIKLGKNSTWRQQVSGNIKKSKHLAYSDRTCITALEDFLEKVVKESQINLSKHTTTN